MQLQLNNFINSLPYVIQNSGKAVVFVISVNVLVTEIALRITVCVDNLFQTFAPHALSIRQLDCVLLATTVSSILGMNVAFTHFVKLPLHPWITGGLSALTCLIVLPIRFPIADVG